MKNNTVSLFPLSVIVFACALILVTYFYLTTTPPSVTITLPVLESHSAPDHNPNISGTQARANITAFLASMTAFLAGNGQDPRNQCGETKDATGAVIRIAIWIADSTRSTGGYLVWYFNNVPGTPMKGPWGGSYDISQDNFAKDRNAQLERDRGWTWSSGIDCNSIKVPSFLQAAQP